MTVADETHFEGHGSRVSYPVRLHGSARDVKIADAWSFDRSWLLAKEAAEFLELKLWDATSRLPIECSALDPPLVQRLDRMPGGLPQAPPTGAKSRIQTNEYGLTALVPASGFRLLHVLVGLGVPPVLSLGLRYHLHVEELANFGRDPWFWGLTALFAVLLIGAALLGATLDEQVTVSKGGIQLVRRSWFGRRVLSIPLGEVLQVEVVVRPINYNAPPRITMSKQVIEIRGVRHILGFGSGLAEDELRWLVQCLKGGLTRYGG